MDSLSVVSLENLIQQYTVGILSIVKQEAKQEDLNTLRKMSEQILKEKEKTVLEILDIIKKRKVEQKL